MTDTLPLGEVEVIPSPEEIISAHLAFLEAGAAAETTTYAAGYVLRQAERELPAGLAYAYSDELAAWLSNPAWSAQTKATYRQHLVRFYAWATSADDPWLSYNPAQGLRRPRVPPGVPRPAADEQVRKALTDLEQPWRLHCLLAAYQGLRCIEIARLRRADVNERQLYVHGKGNRWSVLPTHELVWCAVRDLPDGHVTSKLDGSAPTAHWVSHGTRHALHRLGLDLSLHTFRHWYGTNIQRRYRDLRVTQELLRHASPQSTAVYTLVTERAKREALAGLPDLTGPTAADEDGDDAA